MLDRGMRDSLIRVTYFRGGGKLRSPRSVSEIDKLNLRKNLHVRVHDFPYDSVVSKRFRVCNLDQEFLLPPSLQDWLPEDHLGRFLTDVANELDLSAIYAEYERKDGRGLSAFHPLLMTRLLLYGYCVGITSSRKIEKATYENLAFRYLSADQHPDHDTLAAFR